MPASLRDTLAQARRGHVLGAAARVFAERGYHRATIRDVAVAAGVSDGTIYNVFDGKPALLRALLDPLDEAEAPLTVQAPSPDDPRALVREMLRRRWARYTPLSFNAARVVLSEALADQELGAAYLARILRPALDAAEPVFASLAAAGVIRSADPTLLARNIAGAVLGLLVLRLLGDAPTLELWDGLPDELAALVVEGLLPRHGGPIDDTA